MCDNGNNMSNGNDDNSKTTVNTVIKTENSLIKATIIFT